MSECINKPLINEIKHGFKINHMNIRDLTTGKILWKCDEWDLETNLKEQHLPKELLKCKEIVREINFSSVEQLENLELIQNFYLKGQLIESCHFYFGFVMPNSTNNWEQIIEAKDDGVLPLEILSGNLIVETFFLANDQIISKNKITIYYV